MSRWHLWKRRRVYNISSGGNTDNDDFKVKYSWGLSMMDVCTPMKSIPEHQVVDGVGPKNKAVDGDKLNNNTNEEKVLRGGNSDLQYYSSLATIDETELEDDVFENPSDDITKDEEGAGSSHQGAGPSNSSACAAPKCKTTYRRPSKYLKEYERQQVEKVFSGLNVELFVCSSGATLYFCRPTFNFESKDQFWTQLVYGVPVVVLDKSGPTNNLWLYVTSRCTTKPLWKEHLNFQSMYMKESDVFHVFSYSKDTTVKIGVSFDCSSSATDFWVHICRQSPHVENFAVALAPFGIGRNIGNRRGRLALGDV